MFPPNYFDEGSYRRRGGKKAVGEAAVGGSLGGDFASCRDAGNNCLNRDRGATDNRARDFAARIVFFLYGRNGRCGKDRFGRWK